MRDAIVALDLETTGLNKDEDAIIEIGAARFQDGELLDTFSYLINPGRNIPDKITALTGIRTEDLLDAPRINDVLPDLRIVSPETPLWDALRNMTADGVNQLPVLSDGQLVGMVSRENLISFLHARSALQS